MLNGKFPIVRYGKLLRRFDLAHTGSVCETLSHNFFATFLPLQDIVVLSGFTVRPSPTVKKDKMHACNLHLDGTEACVYVRMFYFNSLSSILIYILDFGNAVSGPYF